MVGSYCRAEKVGVFTPAPLDKVLKHSVERAEELGPEGATEDEQARSHRAQKQIKRAPLHSSFIVTLLGLFCLF